LLLSHLETPLEDHDVLTREMSYGAGETPPNNIDLFLWRAEPDIFIDIDRSAGAVMDAGNSARFPNMGGAKLLLPNANSKLRLQLDRTGTFAAIGLCNYKGGYDSEKCPGFGASTWALYSDGSIYYQGEKTNSLNWSTPNQWTGKVTELELSQVNQGT
jgi:hypothetical protein